MEEHVEISVTEGLAAVADLATKELTAKQVKFVHAVHASTAFFLHSFPIFPPFFLHSLSILIMDN